MAENDDVKYVLNWKINSISLCPQKVGEYFISPLFFTNLIGNTICYLVLFPRELTVKLMAYPRTLLAEISGEVELLDARDEILASIKFEKSNLKTVVLVEVCEMKSPNTNVLDYLRTRTNDFLLIRCQIKTKAQTKSEIRFLAESNITFDRNSFKWIINWDKCNDWVVVKQITDKGFVAFAYEITVSFSKSNDYLNVEIKKLRDKTVVCALICKIVLLDKDGNEALSKADIHWYDATKHAFSFPKFIHKNMLIGNEDKFITNDTFTLLFDLYFPDKTLYSETCNFNTKSVQALHSDSVCNLQENFRFMLSSATHSDVKLKVDNQVFPAHKCVLCSRSPVFRAMFEQDMVEKNTGVVNIPGIDFQIMKAFLEFLYTGEMDNLNCENLLKLILVANKYQVASLEKKCSISLMEGLNVNNVCGVLSTADKICDVLLKTEAINFIKMNSAKVFPSDEWKEFIATNAELTTEVFSKFSEVLTNASKIIL